MELASFSSSENGSAMEAMAVDTLLASAGKSLVMLLMATRPLLNHDLPKLTVIDERFPFEVLHKKQKPVEENKDGSATEDDDEDAGDEDFSGEEGGEEEEDPVDNPEANGNAGSDDDGDNDENGEEGEDDKDDEEEDEEDDEEEEDEEDDRSDYKEIDVGKLVV